MAREGRKEGSPVRKPACRGTSVIAATDGELVEELGGSPRERCAGAREAFARSAEPGRIARPRLAENFSLRLLDELQALDASAEATSKMLGAQRARGGMG